MLRHLLGAAMLVWLVASLVFVLSRLAPGDPVTLVVAPGASAAELAAARERLGLAAPLAVQYAAWARSVLSGDLGASIATGQPVVRVLADALPISLALGGVSLLLSFALGLTVGWWQARRRGTASDTTATVVATTFASAPAFWLALAAIALFTYGAATLGFPAWLRLPAFGLRSPALGAGESGLGDVVRHAVLPVLVLALVGAAGIARYGRSAFLDVLRLDLVRAARGRGVGRRQVALHVVRVALPTLLVLFALALPGVIAGSVFVETIFAWPGMGRAMVAAIAARDYPVVLGGTLLYAAMVIVANLAADLTLPLVDPRIR
ncbi:MAG TPA: ABC transporter permease [Gemmatimonadaceae bacterium]|nr:ABC transporter permease [Gemmatimonadaceae bacterium]